ncbi:Zn-ribbon domain-containing OB-fold protein [Streptomyces boninensis]|uniref:Zn-ribbon domain-containing OB-fold protein n=1 Tax=Streptomyces boninensis TaxID=2039455 RepID=UPI003B216E44
MAPTRTPAVAGLFTEDGDPRGFRLLGTRCAACGALFFPREDVFCRDPSCTSTEFIEVALSPRGRIWSYTDCRYPPPPPYPRDPDREWEPYALLAVELKDERIVVMGQAVPGVRTDDLEVGMPVEVVPGVLHEDAEQTWTTWHFRPADETEETR